MDDQTNGWMDDRINGWNDASCHDVLYYINPSRKWWQTFWEEKCHVANGKAQACTQSALFIILFSFERGGGGGRIFFLFFFGSQCVPTMFPLGSQWVLNMSPKFPMCSQHVVHSTSLLSHMFWQMLSSFHLYRYAKGDEIYTSKQNFLF